MGRETKLTYAKTETCKINPTYPRVIIRCGELFRLQDQVTPVEILMHDRWADYPIEHEEIAA